MKPNFFAERIVLDAHSERAGAATNSHTPSTGEGSPTSVAPLNLTAPARQPYRLAKRGIDVIGAACLIVALMPVIVFVAVFAAIASAPGRSLR